MEDMKMVNDMLKFFDDSPTAFNVVDNIKKMLFEKGYEELFERDDYKIKKGGKYFITRNGSSIFAFNVGKKLVDPSLHITSSHTDCPTFKLKPNPIIKTKFGVKLNIARYGGALSKPWFDRPLSLAGRVFVRKKDHIEPVVYLDKKPFCIFTSMAPHLDREIETRPIIPAVDMVPLVSLNDKFEFNDYLSKNLKVKKEDICDFDLFLYPVQKAFTWGDKDEFISSFHVDNLECVYITLKSFVDTFNDNNINVFVAYDNEEIGSLSRQGAGSDFLQVNLQRISKCLNISYGQLIARGMQLSCDNAQGIHPNHPDLYDLDNCSKLNGGVVVKFNPRLLYTSDGLSSSLFKELLVKYKIPYQIYANKTGIRGGATLGNISNGHVSLISVDIGLAQWAMHSITETCGSKDVEAMLKAIKCFYKSSIKIDKHSYKLL